MEKLTKKEKEELYNDSWMYILLLTTLVILAESLKTYKFVLLNSEITYSVLLLPLIFLISNFITKKYGHRRTVVAISISGVVMVLYVALMSFAIGKVFMISDVSGGFCGYVISQLVNLTIYAFLLNNTKSPGLLVYANYMFSLIVFYMFYTLILLDKINLNNFWNGYFVTLLIQAIICIIITVVDKKIKRGIEK